MWVRDEGFETVVAIVDNDVDNLLFLVSAEGDGVFYRLLGGTGRVVGCA